MAAGLISIDIEARLAKLEEGIGKANRSLDTFGRHADLVSSSIKGAFAGLLTGLSFAAILDATKAIVSQAAALGDLAQASGSSVEALSRLNNQAKISGADLATVENAVLRLSAGMAGVDDESSKVKEALKILGVTAKDPAEAIQEIALKLATYADGVNKVGLAQALFGKQGLQFLKTLQDIADLQDVSATVTAKQAREAEALQQALARLSVEAEGFKNIVLSGIVPALRDMVSQFSEGIRVAGGFTQALRLLGQIDTSNLAGETLRISAAIEHAQEVIARNERLFGNGELFGGASAVSNLQKQLSFVQAIARARGLALIDPSNNDARDFLAQRKPQAPNPPQSAEKLKAVTSEAQRYLETLQKQFERTQELTVVEQFLRDIQLDRIKGLTPALKDEILAIAQELDEFKALTKEIEDSKKSWEEETKAVLDNARAKSEAAVKAQDSAEKAFEAANTLRDEIAVILGGEDARKALAKDYADAAIAKAEQNRVTREGLGANADELAAIDAEIDALKERRELLNGKDLAEKLRADADAFKRLAEQFDAVGKSSFATLLTDLTSGKGPGASLKNLGNNLFSGINKIVADRLSDTVFSKDGPLGGFGDFLSSIFGGKSGGTGALALNGSATALTSSAAALTSAATALSASAAASGGSSAGGIFGSLFGSGAGASAGSGSSAALDLTNEFLPYGGGFAVGTPYVPRDMFAKIHKGEAIIPANQNRRGGRMYGRGHEIHITQHINVMPGASTASARQAAAQLRDATMGAVRDR